MTTNMNANAAAAMTAEERRAAAIERAAANFAAAMKRAAEWKGLKERANANAAAPLHLFTVCIEAAEERHVYNVKAANAAAAHKDGEQTAAARHMTAANIRVYFALVDDNGELLPHGMERACLYVTKRTLNNATHKGGREKEYIGERETTAASVRVSLYDDDSTIMHVLAALNHDVQDMYGEAMDGLTGGFITKQGEQYKGINNGGTTESAYHAAFLKLNQYIQSMRTASDKETSTEYITDSHGDIISIGTAMGRVLKQGEKYAPTASATMDEKTAARLGAAMSAVYRTLSPVQQEITRRLAGLYMVGAARDTETDITEKQKDGKEITFVGYTSIRTVARDMGREYSTIQRHVLVIRGKFANHFKGTEFEQIIKESEVVAAATLANADNRRTAEGAARAKAKRAECMRKLRERRAAERAANAAK